MIVQLLSLYCDQRGEFKKDCSKIGTKFFRYNLKDDDRCLSIVIKCGYIVLSREQN